jgi:hypothetical protein
MLKPRKYLLPLPLPLLLLLLLLLQGEAAKHALWHGSRGTRR